MTPQAEAVDSMSTDQVISLIATLPQDQAEAVLLRVVMGLDGLNAGRVLGKRPGAVRVAAHRGLRRLARQLDDGGATVRAPSESGSTKSSGERPSGE